MASDSDFSLDDLVDFLGELRPHLSIAHHIPGHLRLGFDLGALGVVLGSSFEISDLKRLRGVEDVRLNVLARSAVITYNSDQMDETFWSRLLDAPEEDLETLICSQIRT